MSAIDVKNLVKKFHGQTVLHGIDLEVEQGEVVAIIGPSGSGKTTLLRSINLLEQPEGGTIRVGDITIDTGKPISQQKGLIRRLRQHVGFVFQSFNLFPHRTVLENIIEGPVIVKGEPKEDATARARELLAKVGLAGKETSYPRRLSGGQQQRVAIARALVKMPRVLLLDEPLSNLDARLRLQTREEIRRIQRETKITTVFVTHDQEEAMSISDMIVVMKKGVVQQVGEPQKVYDDPVNLFVAKFLGTPPINVFTGRVEGEKLMIGDEAVLDVKGAPDGEVYAAVRPEGFILDENGPLTCKLSGVEVMGRDVSIVSRHKASVNPIIRAIIGSDNKVDTASATVRFSLKPHKTFIFGKDSEERIRFGE